VVFFLCWGGGGGGGGVSRGKLHKQSAVCRRRYRRGRISEREVCVDVGVLLRLGQSPSSLHHFMTPDRLLLARVRLCLCPCEDL